MRRMILRTIALSALLVLAAGCVKEKSLVIVSTNDMHSAIDAFPRLATLVDSLRKEYPDAVLLVDAGDRWTGNPYVDYATEPGQPIIELMNELNYDVATFGNHEFDNGTDTLAVRTRFAEFRKVLANADMRASVMPPVKPYEFVTVNGLKICFLGLVSTEVNGHPAGKPENMDKIRFYDPWETAERYKALGDSCDLYVAVTHIGLPEDSLLAMQRPEIDLIIGGHSHDVRPLGQLVNQTVVTQTGKNLNYAGVTTITYKRKTVTGIENRLVKLDTVAASPRVSAMVEVYKNNPYFKEVVGNSAEQMKKIPALMNLYSDVMRVGTGAQFAFYNLGGMRTETMAAGDITRFDVFSAEPFRNMPRIFMMTLDEVKDLIINKFNSTGKESHMLDLYPSGMSYRIITDGDNNATDVFFVHGQKPDKDGRYKVALSDYVTSAYDFRQRHGGVSSEMLITDLAQDYIAEHSPLKADNKNRVVIE